MRKTRKDTPYGWDNWLDGKRGRGRRRRLKTKRNGEGTKEGRTHESYFPDLPGQFFLPKQHFIYIETLTNGSYEHSSPKTHKDKK